MKAIYPSRKYLPYVRCLCGLIFFLGGATSVYSQFQIRGKLVGEGEKPMPFTNLAILQASDSSVVQGLLTDVDGTVAFELPAGTYIFRATYVGYEPYFSDLTLSEENQAVDLGMITMTELATSLEEVEIVGEKSLVEMKLDKRIFNVGQDVTSRSANALEILGNIPSVTVDGEGSIKLRGSGDVRILVDGRPSGLTMGNGLSQLQGSLIEAVEIITNPSARYEAEGNAGVINIVLKKEKDKGLNYSLDLVAGTPENFGLTGNVNYRYEKLNFFLNYGISYRREPNIGSIYQEVYANDTTFISIQSSEGNRKSLNNNLQAGLDYFFTEKDILTASYRFRRIDGDRINDFEYLDYLFNSTNLVNTALRNQFETEQEPYTELILAYKKLFEQKGHELTVDARYLNYWENSDQDFTEVNFLPTETREEGRVVRQNSINDEYEDQYLIQLDYVKPLGEEGKMEAGIRSSFRDMTNDYIATQENVSGVFEVIPEFDNIFKYKENIQAVYAILGNTSGNFSWQGGLRLETTDIKTELLETGEENPRKYENLFPSAHATWHLADFNDLQLSYSRRVRRPVYFELSPFVTLANGRNFFSGNPDLDPEFTHAMELSYLRQFEKGSLSSSLFYRSGEGTIQRIRTVENASGDSIGFSTLIPQNLNGQEAYGAEVILSYALTPWWKLDASVNAFRIITDGRNLDEGFESDALTWFARQTSRFTLEGNWILQLRGNYEAPQQTPQGKLKAIYFLDLSVKKDFWRNKASLSLNVQDIFNSRINRSIFRSDTFFTEQESQYRRRQINLSLSYRLKD